MNEKRQQSFRALPCCAHAIIFTCFISTHEYTLRVIPRELPDQNKKN